MEPTLPGISFMYRRNRGLRTEPCGAPDVTGADCDVRPSKRTSEETLYPLQKIIADAIVIQLDRETFVGNLVKGFTEVKEYCIVIQDWTRSLVW